MLKKHETTKLFYNKYLYRLGIRNPLASIFRNKNFAYASTILDQLQLDYEAGQPLQVTYVMRVQPIRIQDFKDAQILYNELTRYQDDYILRIENQTVSVYSNDKQWLKTLSYKIKNVLDFSEPDTAFVEYLKQNINTIIVEDTFGYDYKITLGNDRCPTIFAQWLRVNRDKVRITDKLIQDIENKYFTTGRYFYLRSENVLMLVKLIILDSIQRIDKLVSKQDIDK